MSPVDHHSGSNSGKQMHNNNNAFQSAENQIQNFSAQS